MAFNIAQFKSLGLKYGGARSALFSCSVTFPASIGIVAGTGNSLTYAAQAASLPESAVGVVEVPYFGRKIKIAGDRTFGEWRITVQNDEDFKVRSGFEAWSGAINAMRNNVRSANFTFPEAYKQDMYVTQYSKDGAAIRSYQFVGAFPSTVDAIELDWNNQNQIETFNVTIAYDYWVGGNLIPSNVDLPPVSGQGFGRVSTSEIPN